MPRTAATFGTFLMLCACASVAWAQSVTVQCSFSPDELRFSKARDFDLVSLAGGVLQGAPGEPSLPSQVVYVSVPAGATFANLQWTAVSEDLPGSYTLAPAQRPAIRGGPAAWTPPDQAVYARDALEPQTAVVYSGRHLQRGFTTLSFKVYPLAFNPARKQLVLRRQLTLKVDYLPAEHTPVIHPNNAEYFQRITERRVLNPQDVGANSPALRPIARGEAPGVDVLIFYVQEEVAEPMRRLADWYTAKGYPTKVMSLGEAYQQYPGADWAERMRNCIIDYVNTYGTMYVVIASDFTLSVRYCYVWTIGAALAGEDFVETYLMPTDLYYSGLDGDWDANGDGIYGQAGQEESTDPPLPAIESDQADLDYDVIVARYPVRTATEAQNLVDKVIAYETDPPLANFAKRILLTGNRLWYVYPAGEYNGVYFDHSVSDAEMEFECLAANCINPNWPGHVTSQLYDTNTSWDTSGPGSYSMSPTHLNTRWSAGYNYMLMDTHGGQELWVCESGGWYYCENVADLHNEGKPGVILTCACNTGAFDWTDSCLSETFLRRDLGGAIIYLGCSRYGLGYPDTRQGPSADYIQVFFEQLLGAGETLSGLTFAEHKLALAGQSELNGPWRWLQFGINLQGDPLVQLYTEDPQVMTPGYPVDLNIGEQSFEVTNVPADARICLWKKNDLYEVWQGPGAVTISPVVGKMLLTITAPNHVAFQDAIYVFDPSCPGDFNGDKQRNVTDFTVFTQAYGSHTGDADYSPIIDINPPGGDGVINVADFTTLAAVMYQPCP